MITLEQHLAAHWPTVHTRAGLHWSHMYQCKCGWMPPQDDPDPIESIHAAHVAETWREARTVRTVEQIQALPVGTTIVFLADDVEKLAEQVAVAVEERSPCGVRRGRPGILAVRHVGRGHPHSRG